MLFLDDPDSIPEDALQSSVMNYVTVINPTEGIFVTARPPIMNHVTVFNSSSNGFTFDDFLQGDYILADCSAFNCKRTGVYFRSAVHLYDTSLQLNACAVENNGDAGIHVESNANVTVVATNIRNNSKSGCTFAGRDNSRSYVPERIIFDGNNVSENIMDGLSTMGAAKLSVKNNYFSKNDLGSRDAYFYTDGRGVNTHSTLHIDQFGFVDIEICDNTFNDNKNYYYYDTYSFGRQYTLSYTVYVGYGNDATLQVSFQSEMVEEE